jgi:RNA recognition motif-containing protein
MTLYVTNLPAGVRASDLARLFAGYGRVAGTFIWTGHNGHTGQRAGVIDMHDGGGAAIVNLHGRKYLGRTLDVGMIRPWDPA